MAPSAAPIRGAIPRRHGPRRLALSSGCTGCEANSQLGAVVAGEIGFAGDPLARAHLPGQTMVIGPKQVAGRVFGAEVIERFGDAPGADARKRVEGAIVVDRLDAAL